MEPSAKSHCTWWWHASEGGRKDRVLGISGLAMDYELERVVGGLTRCFVCR